ncbi:MAG: hypothetical protein HC905_20080, partial [Bacteroidales bacterium]|nr:hypothetical protein [Bacteroidales bacterium]
MRYKGKKIHTPEGAFAIPVYYYRQHLKKSGADTLIQELLNRYPEWTAEKVRDQLAVIRMAILHCRIDDSLLSETEEMMKQLSGIVRYRFRSSSN